MGGDFTSELCCLQRKHLACEYFLTFCFSQGGVVSASPNPQAGGPPLVSCPRLLIQFIRSYPPYWRPFLHPLPEDTPYCGDRDPQTQEFKVYCALIWAYSATKRSIFCFVPKHGRCYKRIIIKDACIYREMKVHFSNIMYFIQQSQSAYSS